MLDPRLLLNHYRLRRPWGRKIRVKTAAVLTEPGRAPLFESLHGADARWPLETSLRYLALLFDGRYADCDALLKEIIESGRAGDYARLIMESDLRKFVLACFRDHLALHGTLSHGAAIRLLKFSYLLDPEADAIYANGPRFRETSRVTAILVHNKPDLAMTLVLQGVNKGAKGEWIGDDDVPAFRAKIDKADRVFVQIPGGLIVTPPDGEKQAFEIARAMVKKKRRAADMVPKGDPDLIMGSYMRQPSNVLTAIPADLHDLNITIRLRKDLGTILEADAQAKDATSAKDDAVTLGKLIESAVPKGFVGMLARKYVAGYTITSDGDVVRFHHELDGDRLESAWTLIGSSL